MAHFPVTAPGRLRWRNTSASGMAKPGSRGVVNVSSGGQRGPFHVLAVAQFQLQRPCR